MRHQANLGPGCVVLIRPIQRLVCKNDLLLCKDFSGLVDLVLAVRVKTKLPNQIVFVQGLVIGEASSQIDD